MHNENVVIRCHRPDRGATPRAGPRLGIAVEKRHGGPVLAHVAGEVDMLAAPRVLECVEKHLPDRNGFVLDLAQVDFLAVSGLLVLVDAEWRAERDHLDWAVVATDHAVTRPLEVCGLTDVLPTYGSVRDAVAAVSSAVRAHARR